ncbi:MAG: [protein-PII] uridylyltransferase [Verrucomicrobiota bacterium]
MAYRAAAMPNLSERIETHAERVLPLPAGRSPAQELMRYKKFLKVETHRLKIQHRAGVSGVQICRARALILDLLLKNVLEAVRSASGFADKKVPRFALVAIGGYGRGELNPQSDIDIMFLHEGDMVTRNKAHPFLEALTGVGGLLYTLYDLGFKVGHSVRSVEDCVMVANADMQSKTSLIEARLIAGDGALFQRMQAVVLAKCVRGYEDEYIAARLEDQSARRAKYGNSACMQEPNIKNGCGGLRDFQNLVWMAYFKYRTRSLADLEERGFVSNTERRQLENAYDFLLRVRNELHYTVNRAVDVLPKSIQPAVAHSLGYTDRSPRVRLEKFMRDLYIHARHIYLITRTLEQRLALLPQPDRRLPSFRELIRSRRQRANETLLDGFKFYEGQIHPASNRVFRDQPRRLMRVFLYAQQRGLKLHPDLAQLLRNQLALVDRSFIADEHVHETFLEILNQRGAVAPILREMHDVGFLGKYVPEFGRLTCLVQHEFYHQYAADEHTLMCLEKLDKVWEATEAPFSKYAGIFQQIEQPFVLYLALLLHDAGKVDESDRHSITGGQMAGRVAKRLGLDAATNARLRLLIEKHLLMAQISQRRDLDDRAVIHKFAAQIETVENLNMLTLHTFVDSLGTSDKLWNDFKDSLLWTLYQRTMTQFSGSEALQKAEEMQRDALADEVRQIMPATFHEDEVGAHFANLPPRYFLSHTARNIMEDVTLVHRFMHLQMDLADHALEPVVGWHNNPDRGYTEVRVCTWDRAGLFSKIAGSLTAAGLNILSAQIFSRADYIAIDSLFVTDAATGKLVNREEREAFEKFLDASLNEELDLSKIILARKPIAPLYQSVAGERMPTVIQFDNDTSDTRTVIDLETEDRIGLLYVISQAIAELDLDISLAKVSTERGAAIDSFYVCERNGNKLLAPEQQKHVERKLRAAIARLDK